VDNATFLVCSKGMYFDDDYDVSVRVVEWIEVLRAYGVDKVIRLNFFKYISEILIKFFIPDCIVHLVQSFER
jgi:hypothetical protein